MIIDVLELRRQNENEKEFIGEIGFDTAELGTFKLVEPLEYEIRVRVFDDEVILDGTITARVELECVRCLEKIVENINIEVETAYVNSDIFEKYEKDLASEHKFDYHDIVEEKLINNQINLKDLMREYLLLNIPEYPVCVDTCTNLEDINKYQHDGIDPRWKKLLEINQQK